MIGLADLSVRAIVPVWTAKTPFVQLSFNRRTGAGKLLLKLRFAAAFPGSTFCRSGAFLLVLYNVLALA